MDISRVKLNLGRKVIYHDTEYVLSACVIRASKQGYFYQAELRDLSAVHSVIVARLSEVEEE